MTGSEIKSMILSSGLKLWQVAQALGLNDGNFSRRLRKPFNDSEVARIKDIIADLSAQNNPEKK
ncbi:MAG: hypothetical protein ACI4J2_00400 [Ruminococcus sp.]